MRRVLNLFKKFGAGILSVCGTIFAFVLGLILIAVTIIILGGVTIAIVPISIFVILLGLFFVLVDWIKKKLGKESDDVIITHIDDDSSI